VRPGLWHQVWSRQLRLASEDEFWRGLDGQSVAYAIPPPAEPPTPLPDYLLRHLRGVLHYSDEQIAVTSRDEAQALLNEYYSQELSQPADDA
jgi:hypothetical protein